MLWAEWGNGGTVSKCTVVGHWPDDLEPWEWYVVLAGSGALGPERGRKAKKAKQRKWEREART